MKQRSLILLAACFGICLLLYACRKEIRNAINKRDAATTALTNAAKSWHSQHLIPTTGQNKKSVSRLSPLWNSSWTVTTADKTTLLVVPAREHRLRNRNFTIRRFLIFRTKEDKITSGRITEFVGENYNVENNIDFLIRNQQQHSISGFSGAILHYDVNYRLLDSRAYENGAKSTKKVEIGTLTKDRKLARRVQITTANCQGAIPVQVGFPPDLGPDCLVNIFITTITDQDGCVTSITYQYISHTCPGEGGGGSGSGSGDGENPPYGGVGGFFAHIQSLLTDRCLIAAYNKMMQGNWANPISQAISNIFSQAETIHLFVDQSNLLPNDEDGNTTASYSMSGDGSNKRLLVNIELNANTLPSASQEYVVSTLFHEALHAIFRAEGKEDDLDHEAMVTEEYFNQMTNALMEVFPNMLLEHAKALSWSGLRHTDSWSNLGQVDRDHYEAYSIYHKIHIMGTPCPPQN